MTSDPRVALEQVQLADQRSRPGPVDWWERFDAAVTELGEALEGVALSAIARAFGELSDVARDLAGEIERLDAHAAGRRRAG